MKQQEVTYWIASRFRRFTDGEIGTLQHRMLDCKESVVDLASEIGCAISTLYRVRAAVPAHLVTIDPAFFERKRKPRVKRKMTRRAI